MTDPNPFDTPDLYDVLTLGGVKSPGKVTLSGHDRLVGWDVKKGSGQKGASITRTSEDPIEFKASFYLVDDKGSGKNDFAKWPEFMAVVNSTTGKTPKAVDIYHPDLAEVGIKSVVKRGQVGTVHDGMGGQTKVITFLEYFPPAPAGGSPKGSSSKATTNEKKADPNADLKAELDKLTNEYQRVPEALSQERTPR